MMLYDEVFMMLVYACVCKLGFDVSIRQTTFTTTNLN